MADIILKVGGDLRPLEKEIARVSRKGIKPFDEKSFTQPLGRITGQLGEFEKSLEASNARVLAFGASAGALVAVQQGLKAIADSAINVEKRLADINVILNASGKSLEGFSKNLFGVAKNTATSFNDVADAATELARQGLSVEQTLKRTQDALILTRLSGLKAAESVEAITAALNSFSTAAIDSSKFVSKLAAVDAAFAVSSKDLAEAVKRVGSSAIEAGLGIDELIAAVTAAQQITARGGAVIGNSFKTIFTRIQRPRVIKELENLGIAVRGVGGSVKPAMQILQELAKTYDNLSSVQKAATAELIGGVFQVNVLKASLRDLSKDYSLYANALNISNKATDEAARRNEELNKTVSATLNKTIANLTNFGSQVGQLSFVPAIKKVLGGINSAISDFNLKDPDEFGEKLGAGVLGGLGKFLEGPGILVVGVTLVKTFSRLAKQVTDAFKTISNIGRASDMQLKAQQQVSEVLAAEPNLLAKIQDGTLDVHEAHRKILFIIEKENKAQKEYLSTIKQVAQVAGGAAFNRSAGSGKTSFAKGFVPNFNKDKQAKRKEVQEASYSKKSTRAVKDRMPGIGTYYRNTEEKKISGKPLGLKQDFIVPPKGSPEGDDYRKRTSRMGIDIDNLAYRGHVPNFATPKQIQAATAAMQFVPQKVLTGETMGQAAMAGRTTKRLDTTMYGLRPANVKSFHKSAGSHYGQMVRNTTDDVFGANYNKAAWKFLPEKKNFAQTMGSALQDMIGGLAGVSGGAGGAGVDMASGVGAIWKNHGKFGIDKRFTPGFFSDVKAATEIKSRVGTVVGTKDRKGNWKTNPAELIKKGALSYGEQGGDMAGATTKQLTDIMKNLNAGFVPNFLTKPQQKWADRAKKASGYKKNQFETRKELADNLGINTDALKNASALDNEANTTFKALVAAVGREGQKKFRKDVLRAAPMDDITSKNRKSGDAFEKKLSELGKLPFQRDSNALDFSKADNRMLNVPSKIREKIKLASGVKYGDAHSGGGHGAIKMLDKVISDISQKRGANLITAAQNQLKTGNTLNIDKLSREKFYDVVGAGKDSEKYRVFDKQEIQSSSTVSNRGKKVLSSIKGKKGTKLAFTYRKDDVNLSGGYIPNFATGLFDSDRLPTGINRNTIIDSILASGKPMHVFHGPAGGGKTTAAMKRYPNAQLISSLEQIAAMNDFAVVSGTSRSKKSGQYSARAQEILNKASKITAVIPPRDQLMKRRFGRLDKGSVSDDRRDPKELKSTLRAPGTDYRLYSDLKKGGKNLEVLRSGGVIPNFAYQAYRGHAGSLATNNEFAKFFNKTALSQQWGRSGTKMTESAFNFLAKMGFGNYANASWASMIQPSDFEVAGVRLSKFSDFHNLERDLGMNDGKAKYLSFMGVRAARPSYHLSADDGSFQKFGPQAQIRSGTDPYSNFGHPMKELDISLYSKQGIQTIANQFNKSKGKSRGFIPNFANPLKEAIAREAGAVPKSAIRIGQSNDLRSGGNPMGLGVYNTQDEPNGLIQGIQRAKKEKRNPKTYGAARGFLPNFAESAPKPIDMSVVPEDIRSELIAAVDEVKHGYSIESESIDALVQEKKDLATASGMAEEDVKKYSAALDKAAQEGKNQAVLMKREQGPMKKAFGSFKKGLFESSGSSQWESRMLSLSFAIPMVTESVKKFGGKDMPQAFTAVTDSFGEGASMFTGLTSLMPGPYGKMIAGIAAGGLAASSLAKSLQNQSKAMAEQVEKNKEAFTTLQNSLTSYAQAFSEFKQAAADPKTTGEVLLNLQNKLQDYMDSIPSEFALQIAGARSSQDIETTMAKILKEESQKQTQAQIALDIQTNIDAEEGIVTGFVDVLNSMIPKLSENSRNLKNIFKGSSGELKLQRLVDDMRKGVDFRGLSNDMANAAKASKLETANRKEFISLLGAEYDATAQLQVILSELSNNDLKEFQDAILASARASQRQADAVEAIDLEKQAKAAELGIAGLKDSLEILKKNLETELNLIKNIGGGFEAFMNPKSLEKNNKQLIAGIAAIVRAPAGEAGVVGRGRGAMDIMGAQLDFGTFIPQLDPETGKFGKTTEAFFQEFATAAEKQFQEFVAARIKMMQSKRATLIKQGKSTEIIDMAISNAQTRAGTRAGMTPEEIEAQKNLRDRGFQSQFEERIGLSEMRATQFTLGTRARKDPKTGAVIEQPTLLGQLEAKGVQGTKQQAIVKQAFESKFNEELEEFDDAIATEREKLGLKPDQKLTAAQKRDDKFKDLVGLQDRRKRLEDAKTTFQSTGLKTTAAELRGFGNLGIDTADPSKAGKNFLTGVQNAINITGEGETPAQKALRKQMEMLEAQEKKLEEAVRAETKRQQDSIKAEQIKDQEKEVKDTSGKAATEKAQSALNEFVKNSPLKRLPFGLGDKMPDWYRNIAGPKMSAFLPDFLNPEGQKLRPEALKRNFGMRAAIIQEMINESGASDLGMGTPGSGNIIGEAFDLSDLLVQLNPAMPGGKKHQGERAVRISRTLEAEENFNRLAAILPMLSDITGAKSAEKLAKALEGDPAQFQAAIDKFNKAMETVDKDLKITGNQEQFKQFLETTFETIRSGKGNRTKDNIDNLIKIALNRGFGAMDPKKFYQHSPSDPSGKKTLTYLQTVAKNTNPAQRRPLKQARGGILRGPSHSRGGIPAYVNGQMLELEGGEAIINKTSTEMFRSQLSNINKAGGGKSFFGQGGIIKKFNKGGTAPKGPVSTKDKEFKINQIVNLALGALAGSSMLGAAYGGVKGMKAINSRFEGSILNPFNLFKRKEALPPVLDEDLPPVINEGKPTAKPSATPEPPVIDEGKPTAKPSATPEPPVIDDVKPKPSSVVAETINEVLPKPSTTTSPAPAAPKKDAKIKLPELSPEKVKARGAQVTGPKKNLLPPFYRHLLLADEAAIKPPAASSPAPAAAQPAAAQPAAAQPAAEELKATQMASSQESFEPRADPRRGGGPVDDFGIETDLKGRRVSMEMTEEGRKLLRPLREQEDLKQVKKGKGSKPGKLPAHLRPGGALKSLASVATPGLPLLDAAFLGLDAKRGVENRPPGMGSMAAAILGLGSGDSRTGSGLLEQVAKERGAKTEIAAGFLGSVAQSTATGAGMGLAGGHGGALVGAAAGAITGFGTETVKQFNRENVAAADSMKSMQESINISKGYNSAMQSATDAALVHADSENLISKDNYATIAANKKRFDQAKKLQTSVDEVIKTNDILTGAATGGKAMGDRILPFGKGVGESYTGERKEVEKGFKIDQKNIITQAINQVSDRLKSGETFDPESSTGQLIERLGITQFSGGAAARHLAESEVYRFGRTTKGETGKTGAEELKELSSLIGASARQLAQRAEGNITSNIRGGRVTDLEAVAKNPSLFEMGRAKALKKEREQREMEQKETAISAARAGQSPELFEATRDRKNAEDAQRRILTGTGKFGQLGRTGGAVYTTKEDLVNRARREGGEHQTALDVFEQQEKKVQDAKERQQKALQAKANASMAALATEAGVEETEESKKARKELEFGAAVSLPHRDTAVDESASISDRIKSVTGALGALSGEQEMRDAAKFNEKRAQQIEKMLAGSPDEISEVFGRVGLMRGLTKDEFKADAREEANRLRKKAAEQKAKAEAISKGEASKALGLEGQKGMEAFLAEGRFGTAAAGPQREMFEKLKQMTGFTPDPNLDVATTIEQLNEQLRLLREAELRSQKMKEQNLAEQAAAGGLGNQDQIDAMVANLNQMKETLSAVASKSPATADEQAIQGFNIVSFEEAIKVQTGKINQMVAQANMTSRLGPQKAKSGFGLRNEHQSLIQRRAEVFPGTEKESVQRFNQSLTAYRGMPSGLRLSALFGQQGEQAQKEAVLMEQYFRFLERRNENIKESTQGGKFHFDSGKPKAATGNVIYMGPGQGVMRPSTGPLSAKPTTTTLYQKMASPADLPDGLSSALTYGLGVQSVREHSASFPRPLGPGKQPDGSFILGNPSMSRDHRNPADLIQTTKEFPNLARPKGQVNIALTQAGEPSVSDRDYEIFSRGRRPILSPLQQHVKSSQGIFQPQAPGAFGASSEKEKLAEERAKRAEAEKALAEERKISAERREAELKAMAEAVEKQQQQQAPIETNSNVNATINLNVNHSGEVTTVLNDEKAQAAADIVVNAIAAEADDKLKNGLKVEKSKMSMQKAAGILNQGGKFGKQGGGFNIGQSSYGSPRAK